MKQLTRTGILLSLLALGSFGCNKSETAADTTPLTSEAGATDVAGKSAEALLVLKFHHDK